MTLLLRCCSVRLDISPGFSRKNISASLATAAMQYNGDLVEKHYPDVSAEVAKVPKPDKVLKYGTAGESRIVIGS